eukprot:scaffold1298_cov382-Prasinococcus_capsulatus_cf.AAC.21
MIARRPRREVLLLLRRMADGAAESGGRARARGGHWTGPIAHGSPTGPGRAPALLLCRCPPLCGAAACAVQRPTGLRATRRTSPRWCSPAVALLLDVRQPHSTPARGANLTRAQHRPHARREQLGRAGASLPVVQAILLSLGHGQARGAVPPAGGATERPAHVALA